MGTVVKVTIKFLLYSTINEKYHCFPVDVGGAICWQICQPFGKVATSVRGSRSWVMDTRRALDLLDLLDLLTAAAWGRLLGLGGWCPFAVVTVTSDVWPLPVMKQNVGLSPPLES